MCLAIIDQFLATCSNPRWNQWNNIKIARYIMMGVVLVWILHEILFLMYYNHMISSITGTSSCVITNDIFQKYYTVVYLPVLMGILPVIIMIIFGILAYRNVQQIAYRAVPLVRRELDKQLTVMVPFVGSILYICLCIKTISSTIDLCTVYSSSQSMSWSKSEYQSNRTTIIIEQTFSLCIIL
jgi:hypothetical protein